LVARVVRSKESIDSILTRKLRVRCDVAGPDFLDRRPCGQRDLRRSAPPQAPPGRGLDLRVVDGRPRRRHPARGEPERVPEPVRLLARAPKEGGAGPGPPRARLL
jgi:hypothetical protein